MENGARPTDLSLTLEEDRQDTYPVAVARPEPAPRPEPVHGGPFNRRSSERYEVQGVQVLVARRTLLGLWKPIGPPFQVCNIGIGGLNFRGFALDLKSGQLLKLTIFMPRRPAVTVKGRVMWCRELPSEASKSIGMKPVVCGVTFEDYDVNAWAALSSVQADSLRTNQQHNAK